MAEQTSFAHAPVLVAQVLAVAEVAPRGTIVDCTVGGAGHARALLDAFPDARLVGIDRDPEAVAVATERLAPYEDRVQVVHGRFGELEALLDGERVALLLVDLGVSSHQLDHAARGFSFSHDGPLDMRMDQHSGVPASRRLAEVDETTLASVIRRFGEERFAKRIARAVVAERPTTTAALAQIVRRNVKVKTRIDAATRTFQAIRMWVNDELGEIDSLLSALPHVLADHGVAVALTFHSLEDRAVKGAFRDAARGCTCPPTMPVCGCGNTPTLSIVTKKPVVARVEEVARNPRARSAKLRAARRLPRGA